MSSHCASMQGIQEFRFNSGTGICRRCVLRGGLGGGGVIRHQLSSLSRLKEVQCSCGCELLQCIYTHCSGGALVEEGDTAQGAGSTLDHSSGFPLDGFEHLAIAELSTLWTAKWDHDLWFAWSAVDNELSLTRRVQSLICPQGHNITLAPSFEFLVQEK